MMNKEIYYTRVNIHELFEEKYEGSAEEKKKLPSINGGSS